MKSFLLAVVILHYFVVDALKVNAYYGKPAGKYRQIWRESLGRKIAECIEDQLENGESAESAYDFCDRIWNAQYGNYFLHLPLHNLETSDGRRLMRSENDEYLRYAPLFYHPNKKILSPKFQKDYKPSHAEHLSSIKTFSKTPFEERVRRRHIMSILMASMLSTVVVFAAVLFVWSATGKKGNTYKDSTNRFNFKRTLRRWFKRGAKGEDCQHLIHGSEDCPRLKVNDRVIEIPDESDQILKDFYSGIKMETVHALMACLEKYKDQKVIDDEWTSLLKYNSIAEPMKLSGPRPKLSYNEIYDDDVQNATYIASGWPHFGCGHEFWNLVWQKECEAVVNLCLEDEFAELYWPREETNVIVLGHLELHFISEHKYDEKFAIRMFLIRDRISKSHRTVCQYHYFSWSSALEEQPDIQSLLSFRRAINRSILTKPSHNSIILVHCGDGVGRTGAFILLDLVLKRMVDKEAKEINVKATLQHLRDQRSGIVQSKDQYETVLIGIAKEIETMMKICQDSFSRNI
ncbi:hypothetical protein ACOME3_006981 [Neoechinorhynchus agilis]